MSLYRHSIAFAMLAGLVVNEVAAVAEQQPPPGAVAPIGIDATEAQIREVVDSVRAGRKLTPRSWPNGGRVAVAIMFDIDNELLARSNPLPVPLSQGEYGATTGLPRILAMLERQQIPATFFIPAVSAMLHPEMIPAILKPGRHEVGVHGWIHENLPSLADPAHEERLLGAGDRLPDEGCREASRRVPRAVVGVQRAHAAAASEGGIPVRQ